MTGQRMAYSSRTPGVLLCDDADRRRRAKASLGVISLALAAGLAAFWAFLASMVIDGSDSTDLVLSSVFIVLNVVALIMALLLECLIIWLVPRAGRWWHQVDGGVGFGPFRGLYGLEQFACGLAVIACAGVLGASLVPDRIVVFLVILIVLFVVCSWLVHRMSKLARLSLVLTPQGAWLYSARRWVWVPWEDGPEVVGVATVGGHALVRTRRVRELRFFMGRLPLSYARFQHLIGFYARHPECRHELAAEPGLDRVRDLMVRDLRWLEQEMGYRAPQGGPPWPQAPTTSPGPTA